MVKARNCQKQQEAVVAKRSRVKAFSEKGMLETGGGMNQESLDGREMKKMAGLGDC